MARRDSKKGAERDAALEAAQPRPKKGLVIGGSIIIVLAVLVALIPLALNMFGGGVRTEGIDAGAVREATTDVDGTWTVSNRPGANGSSAGFTFDEVLPGERRTTSGSTQGVKGAVVIESGTITSGEITVDMTTITTDSDVRDGNVRRKIFETDTYPEATFTVTEPADVSHLPGDGTVGQVELTGELTIHGQTNSVTHTFDAVRSGDHLVVAGDVPVTRADYGVDSPEFVAAKIADEGEINIRLNLTK